ncbi:hypothetical protein H4Q26_017877 [Puccinia striiformis f. sp. tritici PST-130]|nr:hypothetical protein H4Q26_017877 [Puccinia striiformis f. sp. tritici PST-130]
MASLTDLQTASLEVDLLQGMNIGKPAPPSATRDALYAHIDIIWELLEHKYIPGPPSPNTLREFNTHFLDVFEIQHAANNTLAPSLIPLNQVTALKSLQYGQKKIDPGVIHLDGFFVDYTQATLARLGLRVWAPKLEDSPLSLYNEACRQVALKTFSQAASTFAYAYLKINDEYTKDVELLIPAYNHYVHHLQRKRYEKEKKEESLGKQKASSYCPHKETSKYQKLILQVNDKLANEVELIYQLRDSRVKFASDHKLPQRYRRIVSDINSHSDDEYDPQRDVYVVKKLNYRSANATKFFRRLDKLMLEDDQVNNRKPRRKRLFMKTGPASIFRKAPRGHPLDFYDPNWFNKRAAQLRTKDVNTQQVVFLPDASKSLIRRNAPLENLTDKEFSDQFFTQLTAPYDLTHVIKDPAEDDNDSEEDNGNSEEYIDDLEEDNDDLEEDNDDSEEDNDEHFEDADTIHPTEDLS